MKAFTNTRHPMANHTHAALRGGLLITLLLATTASPEARDRDPLIGPHPYDFPERASIQGSFLLQDRRDRGTDDTAGAAGGAGGGIQAGSIGTIVNNYSTSTAVGNWQQIEMTLGDGAEGLIMTESHQTNKAEANALSKINATLEMEAEEAASSLGGSGHASSHESDRKDSHESDRKNSHESSRKNSHDK